MTRKGWICVGIGLTFAVLAIAVRQARISCPASVFARFQIDRLSQLLEKYRSDYGDYPTTAQGLRLIESYPAALLDPWHREFQYASPGVHRSESFDLYSLGADGQSGGDGFDADIVNWEVSQ